MTDQYAIKLISGSMQAPRSVTDTEKIRIAELVKKYPYFVPARYIQASYGTDNLEKQIQVAVYPYTGNSLQLWAMMAGKHPEGIAQATTAAPAPQEPVMPAEAPVPVTPIIPKPQQQQQQQQHNNRKQKHGQRGQQARHQQPAPKAEPVQTPVAPIAPAPIAEPVVQETPPAPIAAAIQEQVAATIPVVSEEVNSTTIVLESAAVLPVVEEAITIQALPEEAEQTLAVAAETAAEPAELPPVQAEKAEAETIEVAEPEIVQPEAETQKEAEVEVSAAPEAIATEQTEATEQPAEQPIAVTSDKEELSFTPVYTEDYFLHQGIKIPNELQEDEPVATAAIDPRDKGLMVMMSFTEWLLHYKNEAAKLKAEKEDKKAIRTMWQKEKLAAALEEEDDEIPENVFNMAVNSIAKEEGLMSESLAEIYTKQKKYDTAIEMYRKLSLRNPQKNAYFARKIEEVLKEKQS